MSDLADRLQRLRRPLEGPAVAPVEDASGAFGLERLEREMLGDAPPGDGETLSLKARLERLVAVAAVKERERRREPAPSRSRSSSRGCGSRTSGASSSSSRPRCTSRCATATCRSRASTRSTPPRSASSPRSRSSQDFDLRRAVFLDTETTGLAGGAGTAAFLIGVGWVEGERFVVRQYFMRDYHEEAALLHALAAELRRFDCLVTFNGKMFDVPLLDARFRLNRGRFPLSGAPHLDLLHPARRLWKARLESCRLQSLEAGAHGPAPPRGHPRRGDPAGLLRLGAGGATRGCWRGCSSTTARTSSRWPRSRCSPASGWRKAAPRTRATSSASGRVLERARLYDRSEAEYRRALELGPGALRGPVLLRLAWRAKRGGRPRSGRGALGRGGRGGRGGGLARAGHAPRAPGPGPRAGARRRRARDAARRAAPRAGTCGPRTWPRASSGGSSGCCGSRERQQRT